MQPAFLTFAAACLVGPFAFELLHSALLSGIALFGAGAIGAAIGLILDRV